VIAAVALWLVWPVSVEATTVVFDPPSGRPGTEVTVFGDVCLYQGGERVEFSDRFVPQTPEGATAFFTPVAAVEVSPIGGEETEFGIDTSVQAFTVPRMPTGDYYLYVSCTDASACCVLLEPTFRVLAVPDTSTDRGLPMGTPGPVWVLGLAFVVGLGMVALRRPAAGNRKAR
jgi:hypothetical protein